MALTAPRGLEEVVVHDMGGQLVGVLSCDVRLDSLKKAIEDYCGVPSRLQELLMTEPFVVLLVVLAPPPYFTTSHLWELPARHLRGLWTPLDDVGDWFEISGDPYTDRLCYMEPLESGWLHGWVECLGLSRGRLRWRVDLVILEEDEDPWYGPGWGQEPGRDGGHVELKMVSPFASSSLLEATRHQGTRIYRRRALFPVGGADIPPASSHCEGRMYDDSLTGDKGYDSATCRASAIQFRQLCYNYLVRAMSRA